jgi:peptidoglycan/LPS O-acetylase OafA/YrhL
MKQDSRYRTEIDGLRAVAVLAVIVTHFSKNLLPNGYLGVDVFFVISGFVISSSIRSLKAESFAGFMSAFFARRLKRLLPALALCVFITGVLIAGIDPTPAISLKTGLFALFGFSNIYLFANSSDYFARAAEANPFTQTWSLGVEEQFYFVFPAVVWASGYLKSGYRRLFWLVAAATAVSLIAYLAVGYADPMAAFYLIPFRLWELGLGCMLFLMLEATERRNLSFFGGLDSLLALVLLLAVLVSPQLPVPVGTVLATFLTAIVICTTGPASLGAKVLNSSPAQYVGKISYSLYLWHWSVLCLGRWVVGSSAAVVPSLAVAMFLLAAFSYRFVEKPLRGMVWARAAGGTIVIGFVASLTVSGSLLAMNRHHQALSLQGSSSAVMPLSQFPLGELSYEPVCVVDGSGQRPYTDTKFDECTIAPADGGGGQTIWAMGDSMAGHLQGMLYQLNRNAGVGVHLIETPGIPFPFFAGREFEPRSKIFSQTLERAKPGDIVLLSRLFLDRETLAPMDDIAIWGRSVAKLADALNAQGIKLVILGPLPAFHYEDVSTCRASLIGNGPCTSERSLVRGSADSVLRTLREELKSHENVAVFDAFEPLCPRSTSFCSPVWDGVFVFRDKVHLNLYGASELTAPFLDFLKSRGLLHGDWRGSSNQLIDFRSPELHWIATSGISGQEAWGRWTDGPDVEIKFARWLPPRFRATLVVAGAAESTQGKNVLVRVAGQEKTFVAPGQRTVFVLEFRDVPPHADLLTLDIPSPKSPKELGRSEDVRKLGIGLESLKIEALQ